VEHGLVAVRAGSETEGVEECPGGGVRNVRIWDRGWEWGWKANRHFSFLGRLFSGSDRDRASGIWGIELMSGRDGELKEDWK
jgi:hypothetical protein